MRSSSKFRMRFIALVVSSVILAASSASASRNPTAIDPDSGPPPKAPTRGMQLPSPHVDYSSTQAKAERLDLMQIVFP